jgi:microcystin-dependent protein
MADPTTNNRALNIPGRGTDVGQWDVPINNNFIYIDTLFGGVTSIAVSSSNVTLSTAQCQNAIIRLTGVLSANIDVIFPTVSAIYTVENLTTGSYYVRCKMASGNVISIPQGIPTQVFTDGTDTKFWNPPLPGTYWDYASSTVPSWITACTVQPWLSCDGSAVSRTTYAYLYSILGTTWGTGDGSTTFNLPDLRNRARVSVGGSRLTSAVSGVDGATVGSTGGGQSVTLSQTNLPNINLSSSGLSATTTVSPSSLFMRTTQLVGVADGSAAIGGASGATTLNNLTASTTISGSIPLGGSGTATNVTQPTAVAGITLIKT